jgi:hypothetical protein
MVEKRNRRLPKERGSRLPGSNQPEMRTLALPADLCADAEKKFGQVFRNLESMVEFILRDLMREEALVADEAEQRMVEDRLRELGYL